MDRVYQNENWILHLVNPKLGYSERIKVLELASEDQIKCLIEILGNCESFHARRLKQCQKSISTLKKYKWSDLDTMRIVFKVHIPMLRILIPSALQFAIEESLNLFLLSRFGPDAGESSSKISCLKKQLLRPPHPIVNHTNGEIEFLGIREPYSNFNQLLWLFTTSRQAVRVPGFELMVHAFTYKKLDTALLGPALQTFIQKANGEIQLQKYNSWKQFDSLK